jgi:hypothetical protein
MTGIRDTISLSELMYGYYGSGMLDSLFAKDSMTITTTTGVHNAIFGPKVMIQANLNANGLGALPKTGWAKSGFRAYTVASDVNGGAGVGEGGGVPATVQGTYAEVTIAAKQLAHSFDESTILMNKAGKDDVLLWADIADIEGQVFLNKINYDLFGDNDTVAGNNIESLDRICGSYAEIAGCSQDASDLDIYGIDRDAKATWTDAYVNDGDASDRSLTFSFLDDVFANVRPHWDNNYYDGKMILTKFDTLERLQQLGASQQRFDMIRAVEFTMGDGVKTVKGVDTGFDTSCYKGIPIVPDNYCTADTLGRIFVIDGNNLSMCWLQPVQYVDSDNPLVTAAHRKWGEYHAQGEVVCTKFYSQGKVRDLK